MAIDPEDTTPETMAQIAAAARRAGIADENAAYESVIADALPTTTPDTKAAVDGESEAHPS